MFKDTPRRFCHRLLFVSHCLITFILFSQLPRPVVLGLVHLLQPLAVVCLERLLQRLAATVLQRLAAMVLLHLGVACLERPRLLPEEDYLGPNRQLRASLGVLPLHTECRLQLLPCMVPLLQLHNIWLHRLLVL